MEEPSRRNNFPLGKLPRGDQTIEKSTNGETIRGRCLGTGVAKSCAGRFRQRRGGERAAAISKATMSGIRRSKLCGNFAGLAALLLAASVNAALLDYSGRSPSGWRRSRGPVPPPGPSPGTSCRRAHHRSSSHQASSGPSTSPPGDVRLVDPVGADEQRPQRGAISNSPAVAVVRGPLGRSRCLFAGCARAPSMFR
jgi:hypothetical protein